MMPRAALDRSGTARAMAPSQWDHARERRPVVHGICEGIVAAGLLAFLVGVTGGGGAWWHVLVWAAMARARAGGYQAASALVLAVTWDALSGNALGQSAVVIGAAMMAANAFSPASNSRWDATHAMFAGVAVVAALMAGVLVSLVASGKFGPMPRVFDAVMSLVMIGGACGVRLVMAMVRDFRVMRTAHRHG